MHAKFRGHTAHLYRSHWTPKGAAGNSHGYSSQKYVSSLPLACTEVPDALRELLTDAELGYVDAAVCSPAREAAAAVQRALIARDADPVWRIEEAQRLVMEAAERSCNHQVSEVRIQRLMQVARSVRTDATQPVAKAQAPCIDAMQEALKAVKAAISAVEAGEYGKAPQTGARNTTTYRVWMQIYEAVCGRGDSSLMRALQARGFAKSRQG